MDLKQLRKLFPKLTKKNCRFASPEDTKYNCIAFAVSVNDIWWEPDPGFNYFWPLGVPRAYSVSAYRLAFGAQGYLPCDNAKVEADFQKVALYAKNNLPTHASKQLPDGWWASKLGRDVDIEHTLAALENGIYGTAIEFLKKRTAPVP